MSRHRLMIQRPGVEAPPAARLLAKTKRPDLPTLPGTSRRDDVDALRKWIAAAKSDPGVDPYWVDEVTQPIKQLLAAPGARQTYPSRSSTGDERRTESIAGDKLMTGTETCFAENDTNPDGCCGGEVFPCQLPAGHDGEHQATITWQQGTPDPGPADPYRAAHRAAGPHAYRPGADRRRPERRAAVRLADRPG